MSAAAWILAFVSLLFLVALARMLRMERRIDEQAKVIVAQEAERARLLDENARLHAMLRARLQAHNWPHGFRTLIPRWIEWPN